MYVLNISAECVWEGVDERERKRDSEMGKKVASKHTASSQNYKRCVTKVIEQVMHPHIEPVNTKIEWHLPH